MGDLLMTQPHIDLQSATSFADGHPHAQYAWLRRHAPVYAHPAADGGTFWAVTGYDDIRTVERNPHIFSSEPTVLIEDSAIAIENFLAMDDPKHGVLRRMIVPRLMPRAVRYRMPSLQAIARTVVDDLCERGEADLVEDCAGVMAGYTAADLLGISRADGKRLHELFMVIHSSTDVQGFEAMVTAGLELVQMAMATYEDKTRHPRDDVFSLYANADVEGRPTTQEEFIGTFILLTDGSLDTSRNLISGGMLQLFREPHQRDKLCGDLDVLMPAAIEEMLRWLSPVTYIRRLTTQATTLHGQQIGAGDRVAVYFGSGNRDEKVFADPDTFDITRNPNEHIAFGAGGPHFCVGAHLGRAEGAVMIRELLTRLPDLEQSGPETWAATSLTSGLASLPVSFAPTRRAPA